jgi:GAF domain-containing protein
VSDPIRLAEVDAIASLLRDPPSSGISALDRLTCLAGELLESPVSVLTLVEADHQFFASSHGLPEPLSSTRRTPLEYSLCRHVVEEGAPVIVSDSLGDARVSRNRAVVEFGVRAYVGMPIFSPSHRTLGALSVLDYVPRDWTHDKLALLADLAGAASEELGLGEP